jgi:chaperonin GroEL
MVKAGLRNVAAGANAITLKKGIDKASDFLVGKIKLPVSSTLMHSSSQP